MSQSSCRRSLATVSVFPIGGKWFMDCFRAVLFMGLFGTLASSAVAQNAAAADGPKVVPPQTVELETSDGVQVKATWFAGLGTRDTVPIVMVHMFKGNRHDYDSLALALQKAGHSIIVPDLRYHGDSTTQKGRDRKLDIERIPRTEFRLMTNELEAAKGYLLEKHRGGELNIEKLCVVGAELGASLAVTWAALDWVVPPYGAFKQGQDVRALVLLSPTYSSDRGLLMSNFFTEPPKGLLGDRRKDIAVYIAMGAGSPDAVRDAKQVYKAFERFHPSSEGNAHPTLILNDSMKTKLQGTKLLGEATLGLTKPIEEFINAQLVKQPIPWVERKRPF